MGDLEANDADSGASAADRPDRDEIGELLAEVRRTRAVEHELQQLGGSNARYLLLPARRHYLAALESYARAIRLHGWPLPPRMRLQIQLLRSVCESEASFTRDGCRPAGRDS